jgi:hypothetical protein
MRAVPARIAIATAIALLAACAAPAAIEPGRPHEVRAHPLPPYQVHEECVRLLPGDRLHWRFASTAPLAFNIHYHDDKVVVMPVTRERASADEGVFAPRIAQDYCLMWEAGVEGTTIDYTIRLVRGAAK